MTAPAASTVTLFLCGDVMTGRGIDQALPHPGAPHLYEPYVGNALEYVRLAERASGPVGRPLGFADVWGFAIAEFERVRPAARIVNLETAVTTSEDHWPGKAIHYRMHPDNAPCLSAARIDCCVLANNHVLDWGHAGLDETLGTLQRLGIRSAGAGRIEALAAAPAVLELGPHSRVLVFAFCTHDSGVPDAWAAGEHRGGVHLLRDLSAATADSIARQVRVARRAGDLVVASIHWGPNWGYEIPAALRAFAHRLVDAASVDIVHGHSSHHPKAVEVYRDRLILYGCGDFINDYEGIGGYEAYRGELSLMYFVTLEAGSGRLAGLAMTPTRMRRLRVGAASAEETAWLLAMLNREGRAFGTRFKAESGGRLALLR
jgi:poly-gamma-glutamate synthesis protein (capsule biosynthesis protein)